MDINREEYINVNDALKRIGGSMDLYKRLLGQFSANDHIKPLEDALSAGAKDEASGLIHTLKGVAANLSLVKISAIAGQLEQKVKNGEDHGEIFEELKNAYIVTSQEIGKIS